MDQNRFSGNARSMAGEVEDRVGSVTGDSGMQAKGKLRQATGYVQANYGGTAETVGGAVTRLARTVQAQPLISVVVAGMIGYLIGTLRR